MAQMLFCSEVASDIKTIARLHDREPDAGLIEELRQEAVENWFGLMLTSKQACMGADVLDAALRELPQPLDAEAADALAADFANIYLIHAYRAPPTESPWLDKDHLERQGPMFAVAEWYRRHGLAAQDRQKRSDDHLVLQLQFIGYLMENAEEIEDLKEAARFMDEHILRWIGAFSERVAARCQTPFFAGVVMLTYGYLEGLRDQLALLADAPRPAPGGDDATGKAVEEAGAAGERYVPGIAPSW